MKLKTTILAAALTALAGAASADEYPMGSVD